ncbi:hypothetical protein BC831DRAFT_142800 [Entophlyctis helioformis]|nr:hypothetical protein BC831DRAFT_142800 [Entophlyctis helioformis]
MDWLAVSALPASPLCSGSSLSTNTVHARLGSSGPSPSSSLLWLLNEWRMHGLSGHSSCCSVDRIQDAIAPSAMWPDTPASTRVLLTNLVWISVIECAVRRVCCHCLVWHPSRHANPAIQQAVPAANSKDRSIEHVSVAAHLLLLHPMSQSESTRQLSPAMPMLSLSS